MRERGSGVLGQRLDEQEAEVYFYSILSRRNTMPDTPSAGTSPAPNLDDLEQLEASATTMPDSPTAHYNLGLALAKKGYWERSAQEFRTALKLRPGMSEARVNLAAILLQTDDLDGCIEQSLKALEFRPDLAQACINIGVAFTRKGTLDQALLSFERALRIEPNSVSVHMNLGNTHLAMNNLDKSIEHFSRAAELDEGFAGMAYNNLAVAFFYKQNKEKALENLGKAKALGYTIHPDLIKAVKQLSD
jgi:tetratricopeptide (TPR) repeat protein